MRNLVVVDDLMTETDGRVTALFTKKSHHRDTSVLYLVQNLFPKNTLYRQSECTLHGGVQESSRQVTYVALGMTCIWVAEIVCTNRSTTCTYNIMQGNVLLSPAHKKKCKKYVRTMCNKKVSTWLPVGFHSSVGEYCYCSLVRTAVQVDMRAKWP